MKNGRLKKIFFLLLSFSCTLKIEKPKCLLGVRIYWPCSEICKTLLYIIIMADMFPMFVFLHFPCVTMLQSCKKMGTWERCVQKILTPQFYPHLFFWYEIWPKFIFIKTNFNIYNYNGRHVSHVVFLHFPCVTILQSCKKMGTWERCVQRILTPQFYPHLFSYIWNMT